MQLTHLTSLSRQRVHTRIWLPPGSTRAHDLGLLLLDGRACVSKVSAAANKSELYAYAHYAPASSAVVAAAAVLVQQHTSAPLRRPTTTTTTCCAVCRARVDPDSSQTAAAAGRPRKQQRWQGHPHSLCTVSGMAFALTQPTQQPPVAKRGIINSSVINQTIAKSHRTAAHTTAVDHA